MTDLIFRPPTENDVDALAKLHFYMWNEFYTFIPKAYSHLKYTMQRCRDIQIEMLANCKKNPHEHFALLAQTPTGEIAGVGYIGCNLSHSDDLNVPGFDMELYRMYIWPEYRDRNLGTTFMKQGAKWAKDNGYRSALVWSFDENAYGRFYTKHHARIMKQMSRDYEGTMIDLTVYAWDDFVERFI